MIKPGMRQKHIPGYQKQHATKAAYRLCIEIRLCYFYDFAELLETILNRRRTELAIFVATILTLVIERESPTVIIRNA